MQHIIFFVEPKYSEVGDEDSIFTFGGEIGFVPNLNFGRTRGKKNLGERTSL
jgi:hypothetical protein